MRTVQIHKLPQSQLRRKRNRSPRPVDGPLAQPQTKRNFPKTQQIIFHLPDTHAGPNHWRQFQSNAPFVYIQI